MPEGGEEKQPELGDLADKVAAHHAEYRSQVGDSDAGSGHHEGLNSPEDYRQGFERLAERLYFSGTEAVRRNDDGSQTLILSYTAKVDAGADSYADLADMRLFASAAGMKEAAAPLIMPVPVRAVPLSQIDNPPTRSFVQLTYEKSEAPEPLVIVQPSNVRFKGYP
ncbi:hypothetical protein ABZ769_11000 [Streptomyces olivoreticuli]